MRRCLAPAMSEWRRLLLLMVVCGLAVVGALVIRSGSATAEGELRSAVAVVQVDVGRISTCVVTEEHELICGGGNKNGQTDAPAGRFTQVSVGGDRSCAVGEDGALSCWGRNFNGRTEAPSGRYAQVGAGGQHSWAVREDAAVVCWGADWFYGTPLARGARAVVEGVQARIAAWLVEDGRFEFGFQPEGASECRWRCEPCRWTPESGVGWSRATLSWMGLSWGELLRVGSRARELRSRGQAGAASASRHPTPVSP